MLQDMILGLTGLSIAALVVATTLLFARWKRAMSRDARWLLAALLLISILHEISNLGEWSAAIHPTEPLEDYFLLLLPAVWGSFLYVFLRDQSRAELRQSEQRYRSLTDDVLDTTSAGICILDSASHVVWINRAVEEYFDLQRNEIVGRDSRRLIEDRLKHMMEDPHRWAAQMLAVLNRNDVVGIECHILPGNTRRERWLECRVRPIDSGLHAGGRIEHFYDITDRKEATAQREALLRVLETQKAELERFVYTVSHDLKSPLITIQGFLGVLDENLTAGQFEEARENFQRITQAARRMEKLLAELLNLARIGRENVPSEPVSLGEVIGEALELLQANISSRGVAVTVQDCAQVVRGHRVRLVEVFQNLIDNSIKYLGEQPAPRIEIGVEPGKGEVACFVRDNGIGIDPKYSHKVFDLFEQLNPRQEGTGIGLAIVKRIVETHGGRIWLESEGASRGTTFRFTLPTPRPTQDSPA